ncbi:MAG: polyprenol monophosphomannose synthase [Frankiaceae bacterium]
MSATFDDLGRVLVVIPTYDERDNVEGIVDRLRRAVPEASVLVVDDDSPDGTGDVADAIAARDPAVAVLHRTRKDGLGGAYIAGFGWGIERGFDVLVEMDADGSHSPEELPRLLAALRDADLVLGSRWVPGGEVRNWPLARKLLSRGGNAYARVLLGVPLHDATGGFRAFRRKTLDGIDYRQVASQGYCFQVDLAWRSWRRGFQVTEVPITFVERERGQSKMSRAIVGEALVRVTLWGLASRRSTRAEGPARDEPAAREGSARG